MGTTVITNTLVAAFKTKKGNIFYAIFHETFSKNCLPHIPHWSCCSIAPLKETIQRIFYGSSGFEGGIAQWRNGYGKPESYIAKLFDDLESPVGITDRVITLKFGKNYLSALEDEKLVLIKSVLIDAGYDHLLENVETREPIKLSLLEDGELLAKLSMTEAVHPAHILDRNKFGDMRDASIGYQPKRVRAPQEVLPAMLSVGETGVTVMQADDGTWRSTSSKHCLVDCYVNHAWEAELVYPGNYEKRIKDYRTAVRNAPKVPHGTKVHVDLSVKLENEWHAKRVVEFQTMFTVTPTATGFEVEAPLDDPHGDLMYYINGLPEACTTWLISESRSQAQQPAQQLDLIAAA